MARERENPVFYGWAAKVKDEDGTETIVYQYDGKVQTKSYIKDILAKNKIASEFFLLPRTGAGSIIGIAITPNMQLSYKQIGFHENFHTLPEIHVASIGFKLKGGLIGSDDIIAYDNERKHCCKAFIYPNGTIEFGANQPSFNKDYQIKRKSISGGLHDYRVCI